jgi:hypothetical protein
VLPWLRVLPHFDRMRSWAPDLAVRAAAGAPPGTTVIGIDEDTAIVDLTGGGRSWQVHGRQQAWILAGGQVQGISQDQETGQDRDSPYPAGATIKIDLYKLSLIFCGTCTRSMCSETRCAGGSSNCSPRAS